ncbi:phosphoserine phosphatase SerB [Bacteriovorax sp. BAL6_X]|uniref:phosphoserine phosphatase SerB n=1 Tax=Bacteriovorax sp. BAL6_X TaxID=1201290 RepID=UPI000386E533|nr:phosphoserine phosphatase SerB [Bacteriovorax sp. BAL6_X]EPZ50813.1 phosphoserine phosphatase SerB [Bacteriovorax sp. BAL6_X]
MEDSLKEIIITVSGQDRPGITASLMKVISENKTDITDINQAITHNLLSLSFVIKVGKEKNENQNVLKELLFTAHEMGLKLEYSVIGKETTYKTPYNSFILNCVAPKKISADFISDVAQCLAINGINIYRIDNVSKEGFNSLEVLTDVPEKVALNKVKSDLLNISNDHHTDIAFIRDDVFRRSKRLIVFDMDSTLIQAEVIDELAKVHGIGAKVSEITERAMNGEIDFNQSLIERVSHLKGLSEKTLQDISLNLPLTDGVEDFIRTVKKYGYKVAVISGGFTYFANHLKEKLDLDYAFANELEIEGGELTGRVKGTIINADQKAVLVNLIAQQENISLEQVVAIGDGANDLPMLAQAGLGIAFHAKDIVRKNAQNHMSHGPMTSILYFLGIPGVDSKQ